MRGSTTLVVSEKTSRLQVDHQLALRMYYRAADSILRQARIYRKENNPIDLYVLLLRFSSLVMETIPHHRDYRAFLGREKMDFRKRLLDVLSELETLKPVVQREVSRYNNVYAPAAPSVNGLSNNSVILGPSIAPIQSLSRVGAVKDCSQSGYNWTGPVNSNPYGSNKQVNLPADIDWQGDLSSKPADMGRQAYPQSGYNWSGDLSSQALLASSQRHSQSGYNGTVNSTVQPVDSRGRDCSQDAYCLNENSSSSPVHSGALPPQYSSSVPSPEDRMNKLSFSIPAPTSDSLSRHSFLTTSQRGAAVSTVLTAKVKYPSLIDASPTVIPSLDQNWRTPPPIESAHLIAPPKAMAEPVFYNEADMLNFEEKHSSLVDTAVSLHSQLNRQPSPPPVPVEIQSVPAPPHSHESRCTEGLTSGVLMPLVEPQRFSEESVQSRKPKKLHISVRLMDAFMTVAGGNTIDNLETCGVLAGSLKEGVFYVTTLIIPKQEATSNSCSTINEEDIFEYQDKHDLFQFGWIHVMLPEAVAIVMAPTDSSRKYGIFRLAEPNGIKVIQSCERRGFHPHVEPEGGGSIYEQCGHVLLDPILTCGVVDLR